MFFFLTPILTDTSLTLHTLHPFRFYEYICNHLKKVSVNTKLNFCTKYAIIGQVLERGLFMARRRRRRKIKLGRLAFLTIILAIIKDVLFNL